MLYAADGEAKSVNPAIELAAVRGRLLELLAPLVPSWESSDGMAKEGAFLAGMLSLGDAIMDGSLPQIIGDLCVAPEVESAVLDRRGSLGTLLSIAEAVEEGRFAELAELLASVELSVDQLGHAQQEAWVWFRQAGAYEVLTGTPLSVPRATSQAFDAQRLATGPRFHVKRLAPRRRTQTDVCVFPISSSRAFSRSRESDSIGSCVKSSMRRSSAR